MALRKIYYIRPYISEVRNALLGLRKIYYIRPYQKYGSTTYDISEVPNYYIRHIRSTEVLHKTYQKYRSTTYTTYDISEVQKHYI